VFATFTKCLILLLKWAGGNGPTFAFGFGHPVFAVRDHRRMLVQEQVGNIHVGDNATSVYQRGHPIARPKDGHSLQPMPNTS
jgi:hypothetical protein